MTKALVFPGQGSQSVGMLRDIADAFSEVKVIFEQASELLSYDLWKLIQEGPESELDKTEITQPALLTSSYAIWQLLHAKPTYLAGHSLGEYTALVCAGALSFPEGVQLVAARAKFMQEAVPPGVGAMAAIIGLDNKTVKAICEQAMQQTQGLVSEANINSPGQIVIAGLAKTVECAIVLANENGARMAVLLPVSVPSHCALMEPAAKRLAEWMAHLNFAPLKIPVINNINAIPYTDAASIQHGLIQQLCHPVRWVETIEYFIKHEVTHVIECGPGKVLTGLNRRIDKNLQLSSTQDLKNLAELVNDKKVGNA